ASEHRPRLNSTVESMIETRETFRKRWLVPVALLTSTALSIFWLLYASDFLEFGSAGASASESFAHYAHFDPGSITDAVRSLAGMMAAALGIVITVVSIIVQLSAARYTGVARMFLRDRVNLGIMGFYVAACVYGIWLSVSIHHDFVPRVTLI